MRFLKYIFLSCFTLFFLGCEPDESTEAYVDIDLSYYFRIFEEEAEKRNIEVDMTLVEGYVEQVSGNGVVGQCTRREGELNRVAVDRNYWRNLSTLDKEFLVFHELGHCVLNREHIEDENKEGFCISLMGSGVGCKSNYSNMTRTEYLDELFFN